MDELIRKQDAIEAINIWLYCDKDERMPADVIKALSPVYVPDMNVGDMISRQVAMEMLMAQNVIMDGSEYHNGFNAGVNRAQEVIRNLSPVQPTITHEQAVDYLHETGWLQNHDKILTESKIVPPVQPERIKGHWVEITSRNHTYKCSVCGRLLVNITDGKNNVAKNYPYCHCGADMRGGKNGTD